MYSNRHHARLLFQLTDCLERTALTNLLARLLSADVSGLTLRRTVQLAAVELELEQSSLSLRGMVAKIAAELGIEWK